MLVKYITLHITCPDFNSSQLFHLVLPDFNGRCAYGNDSDSDTFDWFQPHSQTVHKCKERCDMMKVEYGSHCVAYAYDSTTGDCRLYRGGPYTHGKNQSDFKCYVIQGILTLMVYISNMKVYWNFLLFTIAHMFYIPNISQDVLDK